ncbi:hypothetical protein PR048_012904 [Dryococelus australis]|uniref:Uncharacterized protein n=1 Tax=Dryococelus australis TaxID=614101 RepID=A0ABQ9HQQ4_9NEOP|nr:hypothetical protein PR048_012904 [Dryococelus australis]
MPHHKSPPFLPIGRRHMKSNLRTGHSLMQTSILNISDNSTTESTLATATQVNQHNNIDSSILNAEPSCSSSSASDNWETQSWLLHLRSFTLTPRSPRGREYCNRRPPPSHPPKTVGRSWGSSKKSSAGHLGPTRNGGSPLAQDRQPSESPSEVRYTSPFWHFEIPLPALIVGLLHARCASPARTEPSRFPTSTKTALTHQKLFNPDSTFQSTSTTGLDYLTPLLLQSSPDVFILIFQSGFFSPLQGCRSNRLSCIQERQIIDENLVLIEMSKISSTFNKSL